MTENKKKNILAWHYHFYEVYKHNT